MSTTIYYAWRVPVSRLNEFIDHTRKKATARFVKLARERMSLIGHETGATDNTKRYEALCKELERREHPHMVMWLNIWLRGREAYIHGCHVEDCVPKWAKEYAYYDNSDGQLEYLTERQWRARRKRWKEICTGEGTASHGARRLSHVILDEYARPSYELWWALMSALRGTS